MFKSIGLGAAFAALALVGSAAAATISIDQNIPDNSGVTFYTTSQDFFLPTDFTNASLFLGSFASDDAAVIQINGTNIVGTGIFGPGAGNFFFTQAGPSQPFFFALGNGSVNASFGGPFVVGTNNLTVIVNNNNAGINGGNGGLTGGPSSLFLDGEIRFSSAVVPEPATWALMITGFGLAGATLRRRRLAPAAL